MSEEVELQRAYYSETAEQYDALHAWEAEAFGMATSFLTAAVNHLAIESMLDVGSGTGRSLQAIKNACPHARCIGIEPAGELRVQGYRKGLARSELLEGDAE
jgi:ubiquinone/menaquinone biosynthesis C-methylase UbiE